MIAMMGWQSEYETKLMQDRFRSKKILNESQGKFNGGKIPFGYKLDSGNKYIINDDKILGLNISEAEIIKEVFDLYEKGYVCSKICRICRSKGYPKIVSNTHTLARIFRNTSYIGYKNVALGRRPTPALISEQQFYKVNNLVDTNKTKADKGRKHVYLLRGLLKCTSCQDFYVGKQTDDGYICPKNSGFNKTNKNTSCKGGNISISNIDGVVWERAKHWLKKWKVDGFDDEKLEYTTKINELTEQINRYHSISEDIEKERSRINYIFKTGGYNTTEFDKETAKNKNDKEKYNREIALLQSEINLIEEKKKEYQSMEQRIENINAIQDRYQMKEIMKTIIKEIYFHKVDIFKTVVFIQYYRKRNPECILYNSVAKKGNIFRLIDQKYFRYDKSVNLFFAIKDAESVFEHTSTAILKENGIGENLPEYIPLNDFVSLTKKHKRTDIKITNIIDYPIPDETNSKVFDFDTMMTIPDIEGFISTYRYNKMEYFKNLNKSRFSRKKKP
jgi:site-specific DNA recombinase